jgi:hypothetical protein
MPNPKGPKESEKGVNKRKRKVPKNGPTKANTPKRKRKGPNKSEQGQTKAKRAPIKRKQ